MIKIGDTIIRKVNYVNQNDATINLPVVTNEDTTQGTNLLFVDTNNHISQYDNFFTQLVLHGTPASAYFGTYTTDQQKQRERGLSTGIQVQLSNLYSSHLIGANVAISGAENIFSNNSRCSIGFNFMCTNGAMRIQPFLSDRQISQVMNIGDVSAFPFDDGSAVDMYLLINCNNANMTEWYTYGWATYTSGGRSRVAQFLYPSDYGYKKINHEFCSGSVLTNQNINLHVVPFITNTSIQTTAVPASKVIIAGQYKTACGSNGVKLFNPSSDIQGVQMNVPDYLSDTRPNA